MVDRGNTRRATPPLLCPILSQPCSSPPHNAQPPSTSLRYSCSRTSCITRSTVAAHAPHVLGRFPPPTPLRRVPSCRGRASYRGFLGDNLAFGHIPVCVHHHSSDVSLRTPMGVCASLPRANPRPPPRPPSFLARHTHAHTHPHTCQVLSSNSGHGGRAKCWTCAGSVKQRHASNVGHARRDPCRCRRVHVGGRWAKEPSNTFSS